MTIFALSLLRPCLSRLVLLFPFLFSNFFSLTTVAVKYLCGNRYLKPGTFHSVTTIQTNCSVGSHTGKFLHLKTQLKVRLTQACHGDFSTNTSHASAVAYLDRVAIRLLEGWVSFTRNFGPPSARDFFDEAGNILALLEMCKFAPWLVFQNGSNEYCRETLNYLVHSPDRQTLLRLFEQVFPATDSENGLLARSFTLAYPKLAETFTELFCRYVMLDDVMESAEMERIHTGKGLEWVVANRVALLEGLRQVIEEMTSHPAPQLARTKRAVQMVLKHAPLLGGFGGVDGSKSLLDLLDNKFMRLLSSPETGTSAKSASASTGTRSGKA